MRMFLICIGMWLLILWHKENLSVHGYLYALPTRNLNDLKPDSTHASARNDTHMVLKRVALRLYPIPNAADVTKQNRRSLSEYLVKLYYETFLDIVHGNRSTRIEALKGVAYEPKIVPQEEVDSNIEGHGSSVKSTDENREKNNHFPDNKCVCCINNTSGIRNGSDDNCEKCCDTMQSGKNASDSVSNETYTAEEVNVLPANQTAQDSSLKNISNSEKQDGHNSSSLDNKSTSMTPLSKKGKMLDASNGSNLLSQTGYVILVVVVTLIVPVSVVFAVFLYKERSKSWKWTPSRYNKQMDTELVHGLVHSPRHDSHHNLN